MSITPRTTVGLALAAIALGVPASTAGATKPPTPTPPTSAATDAPVEPGDPFCAAGFVLLEAEGRLDDEPSTPAAVRAAMRQLVRAAEHLAPVAPEEIGDLDGLVEVLGQLEAHYAENDYDVEAAENDPALAELEAAYQELGDVADATTDYLEGPCVETIIDDGANQTTAFCIAMDHLGTADEAFGVERDSGDPAMVESTWDDYVHAFDEARVIAPTSLTTGWVALRTALEDSETLLVGHDWDYAALTADPAFEEITAVYEQPDVQEWSGELNRYVEETCDSDGIGDEAADTVTAETVTAETTAGPAD